MLRNAIRTGASLAVVIAGVVVVSAAGRAPAMPPVDPTVVAPAERLGDAFAAVAARVEPAVVSVTSERTVRYAVPENPFDDDILGRFLGTATQRERHARVRGMGSGMLLDHDGHVLTNYHVVRNVSTIQVTLADGRRFGAKIVGTDPMTDVAVLQLTGRFPPDLPHVVLGDSDALKVGSLVLAIGAPFGLTKTVTSGIISATGRADVGITSFEDFLQTDAPINPGNSGGPLVNMRGEVVGMNSAIASGVGQSAGISFAIPSNMMKTLIVRLVAGEDIVRGTLGIEIQNMTPELAGHFGLAEPRGVLISQVAIGSPAGLAGLEHGDVILTFAGQPARDARQLRNLVAGTAPGTAVVLEILRHGKPSTVIATVGKLATPRTSEPTPARDTSKPEQLGLTVLTLTPELAKRLGTSATRGVIVTEVDEDSIGEAAGLEPGDLIIEVDRNPVATIEELARALNKVKAKGGALLLIVRQHATLYVALRW